MDRESRDGRIGEGRRRDEKKNYAVLCKCTNSPTMNVIVVDAVHYVL